MPKIDVSQIAGYETMSAEEKIAALEAFEYADLSGEVERYKNAVSKASADAADWKRKYNEKLTDEERKAQEAGQKDELIAELQRKIAISEHTAKYIALGYDATLAAETAEAMADGKLDIVFANQQKHLQAYESKVKADLIKGGSKPVGDGGGKKKYTMQELMQMKNENPGLDIKQYM